MDREERRKFVRDHRTCIFGYNRKNDGPAMTVVYYIMDGDDLLVSTMADRAKAKAVQRDPHVSLCVLDENWPVTYLQVYGRAGFDPDPGHASPLMRKGVGRRGGGAEGGGADAGRKVPGHPEDVRRGEACGPPDHSLLDLRDPAAPRLQSRRHRHPDPLHVEEPGLVSKAG